jgi:type II secretory pathway predicted ATPase ExeA
MAYVKGAHLGLSGDGSTQRGCETDEHERAILQAQKASASERRLHELAEILDGKRVLLRLCDAELAAYTRRCIDHAHHRPGPSVSRPDPTLHERIHRSAMDSASTPATVAGKLKIATEPAAMP